MPRVGEAVALNRELERCRAGHIPVTNDAQKASGGEEKH